MDFNGTYVSNLVLCPHQAARGRGVACVTQSQRVRCSGLDMEHLAQHQQLGTLLF